MKIENKYKVSTVILIFCQFNLITMSASHACSYYLYKHCHNNKQQRNTDSKPDEVNKVQHISNLKFSETSETNPINITTERQNSVFNRYLMSILNWFSKKLNKIYS